MNTQIFNKEPVWKPSDKSGERLKVLMNVIENKYNLKFADYWDFHKWTTENVAEFWMEMWDFSGIIYSKSYDNVIDLSIPFEECPKWFEGARLNIAENLLRFRDDRIALIAAGEDKEIKKLTYKELYEETRIYAAALRKLGLRKGDRVACYMSNRIEAMIAMLATTSIGAIWTGALPTLGYEAYLSRVEQVQPKFLFTIEQFTYNKKRIHLLDNIKEINNRLQSLEKVIVIPSNITSRQLFNSGIENSLTLQEFKELAYSNPDRSVPDLEFEQVTFSHPVYINYTSGSTGLPKTIVHGFGGLLSAVRDFEIHCGVQPSDIWLSMSAVGWVSWNFAANLLYIGSAMVLFEGVPFFLSPTYLWDLVDELNITTVFITAPTLDELEDRNYVPTQNHHLKSLKTIVTSGSVVKPRNYLFVLNKIKKELEFIVGCASTEFMGFYLVNDQTLPAYIGEISSPSLGVAVECLDDEGNSIEGEMGELAISKPIPSLLLNMWGDIDNVLYKKSYFSKFSGKFTIGDAIIINPVTKGVIVCGRSDETLKQRGCRFGSSEIYNVVKQFPEIKDCICVGQYSKDRDERAVLFIEMKKGFLFSDQFESQLRTRIANELTVRHVPEIILPVPGIPYNANGKKTEIIVKKIINKMPHNPESVVNRECLEVYYDIPQLQGF